MAFNLEQVVPWGRSFDEYRAMFDLSDMDLEGRILGCGDGPAAFNAELTRRGGRIVSLDPLYQYEAEAIRRRLNETYSDVMAQTRENAGEFVWSHIPSVEELGKIRMAAMEDFLSDYNLGKEQGRYVKGELPQLPFQYGDFDLALCSHLLFLYGEQLSEAFHVASIRELCRVAGEVRLFPLLELGSRPSRHLEPVALQLAGFGYDVRIVRVSYEFQRGGHDMMVVKRGD